MWRNLIISSLLLASNAFGALTVTDRGTGNSNASTSTVVVTPSGNMAAGSSGVLCYSGDSANAPSSNLPATITDDAGNTWYQRNNLGFGGSANSNAEVAVYTGYLTNGLTTSQHVTITFTANVTAKTWTLSEVAPASGKRALFCKTFNGGGTGTTSTVTTNWITPVGAATFGMNGIEYGGNTITADSDTSNGSWSTSQTDTAGSATTGVAINSQWKVQTTASSAQTYNLGLSPSADWNGIVIAIEEAELESRALSASTTSEAATVISPSLPLSSGSLGVLCFSADNAGTSGTTANLPTSITDSKSNTWTLQETGIRNQSGVNTGAEFGIYTSILTANLLTTDTITVTYTVASVAAKAWSIWEFIPASNFTWLFVTGAAGTGANTASPTITTASISSGDTLFAMMAAEGTEQATGDADTSNGNWSIQSNFGAGTTTSGMCVSTQYKTVTGTATQTYNPTLTATQDNILGWIDIAPLSTGPSTTQKASFFNLFQ